jgi:phage terminase large subunit-like protein
MLAPKYHIVPEYVYSDGQLAIDFAALYGLRADPWQAKLIIELMGEDESGQFAAKTFGYCVPRRSGKSVITQIISIYEMVVLGRKIIYTSHLSKSADEQFGEMRKMFEETDLKKYVKKISLRTGSEAIYLTNGGSFRIFTRSPESGRGSGCDRLWMDESMSMVDGALAALIPTLANSKKPALVYLGTPSMVGDKNGEMFATFRKNILEGRAQDTAWVEYGADPDDDPNDPETWWKANPALETGRIDESYIYMEMNGGLTEQEFFTERLGIWGTVKTPEIIPMQVWTQRIDAMSAVFGDNPEVFGLDAAPDKSKASISVAGQRGDGKWHIEKLMGLTGIDWIPDAVIKAFNKPGVNLAAVVIDDWSVLKEFIPKLEEAGVPVIVTNKAMMATACEGFYNAVMNDELRHRGQPELAVSLSQARKRVINGVGWGWKPVNISTDLTPLVSCTLALWGARQDYLTPRTKQQYGPTRRVRI